jgi:hypothetical protein
MLRDARRGKLLTTRANEGGPRSASSSRIRSSVFRRRTFTRTLGANCASRSHEIVASQVAVYKGTIVTPFGRRDLVLSQGGQHPARTNDGGEHPRGTIPLGLLCRWLEVGLRFVSDADVVRRRSPRGGFEPRHGVEDGAHLARARSSNGHRRVRSHRHGVDAAVWERPTTYECSAICETEGLALARDSCASADDDQHVFGKVVFAHENPARRHIDLAHERVEEPQLRAAAGVEHREFPEFRRVVSPAQNSICSPPQSHLASRPDLGDHLLRQLQIGCERVVTARSCQVRPAVLFRPWS